VRNDGSRTASLKESAKPVARPQIGQKLSTPREFRRSRPSSYLIYNYHCSGLSALEATGDQIVNSHVRANERPAYGSPSSQAGRVTMRRHDP